MSQARIFLAHAKEDEEVVEKLYDRLKAKGYKPWLDKKDLIGGQRWEEEIPKAIRTSDIFVACLSTRSVSKRGYVQSEFRMALKEYANRPSGNIYMVPLRLDACEIPDITLEKIGINMRQFHWIDYFEPDGFERLEQAIEYQFEQLVADSDEPNKVIRKSYQERLPYGVALDMVYIEEGIFLMGSPENEEDREDSEGPQHRVAVSAFHMGKYPVTQKEWFIVSTFPQVERELKSEPSYFKGDNLPVEQVAWHDAIEFCKRLSKHTGQEYRLPSEAEWEYACRAHTTTPFHFGETITTDQSNYRGTDWKIGDTLYPGNYGDGPKGIFREKTSPVGSFQPNTFGLFDMHGNVFEWCQDYWHENYEGAPTDGSAWSVRGNSDSRVIRGGSWYSSPGPCRSAARTYNYPGDRIIDIGFRVVCRAPRALL